MDLTRKHYRFGNDVGLASKVDWTLFVWHEMRSTEYICEFKLEDGTAVRYTLSEWYKSQALACRTTPEGIMVRIRENDEPPVVEVLKGDDWKPVEDDAHVINLRQGVLLEAGMTEKALAYLYTRAEYISPNVVSPFYLMKFTLAKVQELLAEHQQKIDEINQLFLPGRPDDNSQNPTAKTALAT